MSKALVAIGSMAAGTVAVASVVYLQTNRFALTSIETPAPEAVHTQTVHALRPAPEPVLAPPSSPVVSVPEVYIRSLPTQTSMPATQTNMPAEPESEPLEPCTEWRALGPVSVVREGSDRVAQHRVRMLCPEGERATTGRPW